MGTDTKMLVKKFPAFLEEKINKKYRSAGWELSLGLQQIREVHLNSHLDYDCLTNRSKTNLLIISTIAFLILILAIINYINLSTAIAFTRIRETGIRKIMGSTGSQIRVELLAESVILSILAGIISVILLVSFYPMLNQFTRSDFAVQDNPVLVVAITLLAIATTGFIAGLGPAWLLSRQKALAGIQHVVMGRLRQFFCNGLVSFQFFAAVVLIGTLILMQKQNSFVSGMDLGFNRHSTGSVNVSKGFDLKDAGRVTDELKKIPDIAEVSVSGEMPGAGVTANGYGLEGKESIGLIRTIYTDENFLKCYGIKLKAGRDFRGTNASDASGFLVNQALVDFAGWTNPIGKKISRNQAFEVIGVVEDFHFSSLVRWVLIGFIIACPVANYIMVKWLQSFAYKTEVSWWIFLASGAMVILVAFLTVSWESFKAARRNPVETLRYE